MEPEPSPSHLQTKAYVRQLQVIDNQNLLFEMSSKLEPKDMWRDKAYLQAIVPANKPTHPTLHSPSSQINPAGLSIISGSASKPSNEEICSWKWCDLCFEWFCVSVNYDHAKWSGFISIFFSLFTTEGKPVLIALPSVELNQTGISLICTTCHPGLQKHRLHFGHSWPLKYMRQSDLLNSDLWSTLALTATLCNWLQSFDVSVLNNMDPQPSKMSPESKTSSKRTA